MNSRDRRHLIFLKVSANKQRHNREVLLESLIPSLANTLRTAQCVYTPESHQVIASFLPIAASGVGSGTQTCPSDYCFTEFAYPEKALTFVQQIDNVDPSTLCYLSIAPVSNVHYGERGYWVPKYPVFIVEAGWVQSVFSDLWAISNDFIAVVGCYLEFGMIVDHYCGYLKNDYNPDEIVYEVARWSKAAQRPPYDQLASSYLVNNGVQRY